MADILVSYSHSDRARARALAEALEQHGWSVWWDRQISVGRVWGEVIEEEINKARAVVVLWSPNSVGSSWVKNEAREANDRRILIPALIEATRLPFEFRHVQTADLTAWKPGEPNAEFSTLVAGLHRLLDHAMANISSDASDRPSPSSSSSEGDEPQRTSAATRAEKPDSPVQDYSDLIGLFVGTAHNETIDIRGQGFLEIFTVDSSARIVSARFGFSGRLRAEGDLTGMVAENRQLTLVGTISSLQTSSFHCKLDCHFVDRNQVQGKYFLTPRGWNIFSVAQKGAVVLVRAPKAETSPPP